MRLRALVFVLAFAACTCASEPQVLQVGVLDGKEPTVRVHLRSLAPEPGKGALVLGGKGGLVVRAGDAAPRLFEADVRCTVEGDRLAIGGGAPVAHAVFAPKAGIVRVGGHAYSGDVVWERGRLVNRVPMENYVLGVLRGELPLKEVPSEAAAALAIAVRSYTLFYLAKNRPDFDLDDTTMYQRYVGLRYAPQDDHLRRGVRRTAGLYLAADGGPLKAYYHSTCGGHTTDEWTGLNRADAPSLRGVPCEWCRKSKYYRWRARLSDGEILDAAPGAGAPLKKLSVDDRGPGGRAKRVAVETDGIAFVHAGEFRLAVGPSKLRSVNLIELTRVEGGYVIEGGGWGHGVGLCQMGAIGQAQAGRSAERIVAHYYPAAKLKRAY